MQAIQLVELLLTGFRFALSSQGNAEIVVGLFEIRLERDSALEGGDRSG